MTKTERMGAATLHGNLSQFSGTDQYHKLGLSVHVVGTDGVAYLCKNGKCYWLFDLIASHLVSVKACVNKYGEDFTNFHLWTLTKKGDGAVAEARMDTNAPVKISQEIEYSDFPFDETGKFKLYVGVQQIATGMVLVVMLPGEY